jgi:hypothetical protein
MIKVSFDGYSDSDEYINNTRINVEDIFQQYYPDAEEETIINKEEEEFKITFKGDWTSPEDLDEDVLRDICNSHELYCHISIDDKINKSYYYDEDYQFVYK